MKKKVSFSEKIIKITLAGLLVFVFTVNIFLAWRDSQTVDEGAHIAAGYSYVTTGDFRLNSEHPSLFKILAGLSILPLDTKPADQLDGWDRADQWSAGRDLLYSNPAESHRILFLARLPNIGITLLLVFSVFILGRKLFGPKVGLLAAGLISIDPTLNGHGHLVTNDVFVALGAVVFALTAINYWRLPNRRTLLFLSLAMLLVTSAKFSGAIFIPVGLLIIALRMRPQWKRFMKHAAVAMAVLFLGVWLQYGFQVRSVNHDTSQSYTQEDRLTRDVQRLKNDYPFVDTLFAIPLPAFSYVRGLTTLAFHNGDGHPAYLLGYNSDNGWIYYFPVALSVKLPLAILAFTGGGLLTVCLRRRTIKRTTQRKILLLLGLAGTFLILGMISNINIGVRHIFGMWPFIYILAAFFITKAVLRFWKWRVIIALAIATTVSLGVYNSIRTPLAYQNSVGKTIEIISDQPVLVDSNRDWSQDLYRLDEYLDKRGSTELGEAIFTSSSLQAVLENRYLCSVDTRRPLCTDGRQLPCVIAISDSARYIEIDETNMYAWLPGPYVLTSRVGNSISIFECY